MLDEFADGIWLANGPEVVAAMGFHYPTRMVIVRLTDGALWVWSPVALSQDIRAAVDAIGPVGYLVAPNHLHHVFLADWAEAYPQAEIWAAPGLAEKRGDLSFAGTLGNDPAPPWSVRRQGRRPRRRSPHSGVVSQGCRRGAWGTGHDGWDSRSRTRFRVAQTPEMSTPTYTT